MICENMKFFIFGIIGLFLIVSAGARRIARQAICSGGDGIVQYGLFKYQCTNGVQKLISCTGTPRTNNEDVAAGETKTVNGFWYKCTEENGQGHFSEEPRCHAGSKELHIGETTTAGSLVYLCAQNGMQITGCVFTDSTGQQVQVKSGESAQINEANGPVRHFCNGGPNGSGPGPSTAAPPMGSLNGNPVPPNSPPTQSDTPCTHDGHAHKTNESWVIGNFRYVCAPGGDIAITACVIDSNNELPVGQNVVKFGLLHHCTKDGSKISYKSEICGVGKVNCDASSVPSPATNTNPNPNPNPNNGPDFPRVSTGSGTNPTGSGTAPGAGNDTGNGAPACVQDGQSHQSGESWVSNNLKYSCQSDGSVTILACVTNGSNKEIQLGEIWVLNGLQHICSRRGNGAAYSSQSCVQVQCGPEGLQQQPASETVSFPRQP